jgi:hypothetical protein
MALLFFPICYRLSHFFALRRIRIQARAIDDRLQLYGLLITFLFFVRKVCDFWLLLSVNFQLMNFGRRFSLPNIGSFFLLLYFYRLWNFLPIYRVVFIALFRCRIRLLYICLFRIVYSFVDLCSIYYCTHLPKKIILFSFQIAFFFLCFIFNPLFFLIIGTFLFVSLLILE